MQSSIPHQITPRDVLETISLLINRHQITTLYNFFQSCRSFAEEEVLNVAILGRFKTGKSSFLNHLLAQPILPVGAIPVTAVVIEIEYGPVAHAEVRFRDGRTETVALASVEEFIAEAKNPNNAKQVSKV